MIDRCTVEFFFYISFTLVISSTHKNSAEVNFVLFQSPKILIFHLGIPIGVNTSNIKLAREFDLPRRTRINDWQVMRDGGKNRSRKLMALPYTTNTLSITGPEQVTVCNHSWQTLNFLKTTDTNQLIWSIPLFRLMCTTSYLIELKRGVLAFRSCR